MKDKKALEWFFWGTFGAFLAPSIPHLAYFFLSFEPDTTGIESWFWWIVCYAIAISIDGTILWLSRCAARGTIGEGYKRAFYTFIVFLTVFSWLLNWMYAEHHLNSATVKLSGALEGGLLGVPFVPLGVVAPIMASMFPVLAIMFTFMAGKIVSEVPKSIEDLEQEAKELERKQNAVQRIRAMKNQDQKSWLRGKKDVLKEAFTVHSEQTPKANTSSIDVQNTTDEPVVDTVQSERTEEHSNIRALPKRTEQPKKQKKNIVQQSPEQLARTILAANPSISVRSLAVQIGKSPTTANTLIKRIKAEMNTVQQVAQ